MPQTHDVEHFTYEPIATPALNTVSIEAPFRWLKQGVQDFAAAPGLSLAYGLVFALVGAAISYASISNPLFILAFATGFLLVGPFLAIGLYRVAQLRERGGKPSMSSCRQALYQNKGIAAFFMLLMFIIMIAWIRFSSLAIALYFGQLPAGVESLTSALNSVEGLSFIAVLFISGAIFAFIVYAAGVVSLPLMMDRKTEMIPAIVTSFKAVFGQPQVMLTWAAMIAALTFLGIATLYVGLVFIFPLLGYASWHAYRDLVK